eukprot:TRINITY_DN2378_c5_g1_i1.p1 TRINITY_DN2378_c5_g1~~TRINITY_DN2378_c5_g1_i1.p1  ORF type:complete len:575 (+),score=179.55 TRINITY_DN2378_c5_g1_i1:46-1770(+)
MEVSFENQHDVPTGPIILWLLKSRVSDWIWTNISLVQQEHKISFTLFDVTRYSSANFPFGSHMVESYDWEEVWKDYTLACEEIKDSILLVKTAVITPFLKQHHRIVAMVGPEEDLWENAASEGVALHSYNDVFWPQFQLQLQQLAASQHPNVSLVDLNTSHHRFQQATTSQRTDLALRLLLGNVNDLAPSYRLDQILDSHPGQPGYRETIDLRNTRLKFKSQFKTYITPFIKQQLIDMLHGDQESGWNAAVRLAELNRPHAYHKAREERAVLSQQMAEVKIDHDGITYNPANAICRLILQVLPRVPSRTEGNFDPMEYFEKGYFGEENLGTSLTLPKIESDFQLETEILQCLWSVELVLTHIIRCHQLLRLPFVYQLTRELLGKNNPQLVAIGLRFLREISARDPQRYVGKLVEETHIEGQVHICQLALTSFLDLCQPFFQLENRSLETEEEQDLYSNFMIDLKDVSKMSNQPGVSLLFRGWINNCSEIQLETCRKLIFLVEIILKKLPNMSLPAQILSILRQLTVYGPPQTSTFILNFHLEILNFTHQCINRALANGNQRMVPTLAQVFSDIL